MQVLMRRYLNEFVGLTIMVLMTVALIAGVAAGHDVVRNDSTFQSKPATMEVTLDTID